MYSNSYKNLIVYQKAESLSKDSVQYFSKFSLPKSKEFAVTQFLRAVTSIGANIAEGYGRYYKKYYRQFLLRSSKLVYQLLEVLPLKQIIGLRF